MHMFITYDCYPKVCYPQVFARLVIATQHRMYAPAAYLVLLTKKPCSLQMLTVRSYALNLQVPKFQQN
jgi:hypothetical protein